MSVKLGYFSNRMVRFTYSLESFSNEKEECLNYNFKEKSVQMCNQAMMADSCWYMSWDVHAAEHCSKSKKSKICVKNRFSNACINCEVKCSRYLPSPQAIIPRHPVPVSQQSRLCMTRAAGYTQLFNIHVAKFKWFISVALLRWFLEGNSSVRSRL